MKCFLIYKLAVVLTYQQPSAPVANVQCDTLVTNEFIKWVSNAWEITSKVVSPILQNGLPALTAFKNWLQIGTSMILNFLSNASVSSSQHIIVRELLFLEKGLKQKNYLLQCGVKLQTGIHLIYEILGSC